MHTTKSVEKREFIQYTSKYLKWVENNHELIVTHQNKSVFMIIKMQPKSIKDLRGFVTIKTHGDINAPILPGYDET